MPSVSHKSKKRNDKQKPYSKNLDWQVKNILNNTTNDDNSDNDEEPLLEELKKHLLDMKKKMDNFTQQSISKPLLLLTESRESNTPVPQINNLENEGGIGTEDEDSQLFGKYWKEDKMVILKDNIFCKQEYFEMALGGSCKATHMARRLIEGVFKNEAILASTLIGQSPRAQGKDRQSQRFHSLNALIDFAIDHAEKKEWTFQSHVEISRALSLKIGEIKRQYKSSQILNKANN